MARKSEAYEKSDAEPESRTPRPTLSAEVGRFPDRLREVIGSESVRAFAGRAGLSEAVLRSYLRNDSFPTLDRLDAIAVAAGRPPAWFIASESDAQSQSHALRLHVDTLREATRSLIRVCAAYGFRYDPVEDADLLAEFYAEGMDDDGEISGENVIRLVERIAERQRAQGERRGGTEDEGTGRRAAGKSGGQG